MAYDGKIMRRAIARMEADKQRRAEEFARRRESLYRAEPRLQDIEQQLRSTMSKIIAGALQHGTDPLPAIRVIRDENLDLQRQRAELLLAMGYPMDYLEEKAACDKCNDSGFCGDKVCSCLQKYYNAQQKKELSQLLDLGNQSFDTFSLDWYPTRVNERTGVSIREHMEHIFESCSNFARHFEKTGGNLLLTGATGTGKTFLSACIARAVADKGYSVIYETATHLFNKLEQAKFNPTEESRYEAAKLNSCDLLIVDDLGTEMPGQFVTAALYSLLNDRLLQNKSMIISTNLNVDEMAKRYSPQIASRLYGGFNRLTFVGEDIRVLKNR